MVTYVLDSSAILRFTDNEAGADRVQRILDKYLDGTALVAASALHWGEAANRLYKLRGRDVIPYVDAFGAVIGSAPNHVFVTADFDLKPATQFAKIEFLPAK